ncbi:phosphotriesterase-related protein-like [Halichondria panicea]|uniref:phosphotriesterase-related protein-like n=1 Tax=Halichondria panicea TaxID=6063 RepID=UPI00312B6725
MSLTGKVLTVLGPRDPSELGMVLPHEQPLVDLRKLFSPPRPAFQDLVGDISDLDLQIQNLGKIRQFPYAVRSNLFVDNVEEVASELALFKSLGGGALCDVSPVGVRVKRECLPALSEQTGVHIIAGTAFYVDSLMPEEVKKMTVEEMRDHLVCEVMEGIGGVGGVRCGLIGEVGCSHPLTHHETRSLQAAAAAQQMTGAPLMIHPGANEASPFAILDILESCGADISRTVIGHMDRTVLRDEALLSLARRGAWLEYDLLGIEVSHYQSRWHMDFPSDAQKMDKIKLLIDNGFSDRLLMSRLLMSQDIHTKHRMACYGGHGYGHLLQVVLPSLAERGVHKSMLTQLTTTNPQKWLTFA